MVIRLNSRSSSSPNSPSSERANTLERWSTRSTGPGTRLVGSVDPSDQVRGVRADLGVVVEDVVVRELVHQVLPLSCVTCATDSRM